MPLNELIGFFNSGTGWIAIVYIFFKEVLPKIAPAYAKSLNKNIAREDRLFDIISKTNIQNEKLTAALDGISDVLRDNNHRLERLEDKFK